MQRRGAQHGLARTEEVMKTLRCSDADEERGRGRQSSSAEAAQQEMHARAMAPAQVALHPQISVLIFSASQVAIFRVVVVPSSVITAAWTNTAWP